MNTLEYPIYILCGLAFPISILPSFIKKISFFLPPYHAVNLINQSLNGISIVSNFIIQFIFCIFISLVFIILGLLVLNKCVRSMKKNNTGGLI